MMMNQWSERLIGLYLLLRDLLGDLPPSQEPFSSLCLCESLIFPPLCLHPPATRNLRQTSDLSNPSHHCPFISPPAEFVFSDLIIPPSPLRLFVFCSFKDREPSILSQYPRHYDFPSIHLSLAPSLSFSFFFFPPVRSRAVH